MYEHNLTEYRSGFRKKIKSLQYIYATAISVPGFTVQLLNFRDTRSRINLRQLTFVLQTHNINNKSTLAGLGKTNAGLKMISLLYFKVICINYRKKLNENCNEECP